MSDSELQTTWNRRIHCILYSQLAESPDSLYVVELLKNFNFLTGVNSLKVSALTESWICMKT